MSVPLDFAIRYDDAVVADETDTTKPRDRADEVLVAQAKTGDVDAFEELVRRYRNEVYALSYHFMRNREEAWDIAQEAFIKAHKSLARFRGDAGFKTWLMRITANHCKDRIKKRKLPTVSLGEDDGARFEGREGTPEDRVAAAELGSAIETAVAGLSEKHRLAFVLREYEDMSYQEMADVMECSIGTVMSRLHHARKKLQQALRESGALEGRNYG